MTMPGYKRKRGSSWQLVVTIGSNYTGAPVRYAKSFTGTAKEADKELAKFYAECESGKYSKGSSITVKEICAAYIDGSPQGSLKKNTITGYRQTQKLYIDPYIGKRKASKISVRQLQQWINDLSQKLSPKTVRNAESLLHAALDQSVKYGEISDNPCNKITLPKLKKKEAMYYDSEEAVAFVDALSRMPREEIAYKVLFELALYCGLRKGELLGLDWDDVDAEQRTITIRQTRYLDDNGTMRTDTPKTATSERILSFPDVMAKDFVTLRAFYAESKLMLRGEWIDSPALIKGRFGEPMYATNPLEHLHKLQDANGLKRITLHQLRHTNVSIMINMGLDIKTIQARGGYSNATTPLEIYGHLFRKNDSDIADQIAEMASKKK
jgi:integrase